MADRAHEMTDEIIRKIDERVQRVYAEASEEVAEKLKDYWARFKVKNEIKLKELASGKITQEEYNYWYHGQVCVGQRWKDLKEQLAQDLVNHNQIARSIIDGYMPEVYALNHNFATYLVEHDSLIDMSYTLYTRRAVENLLRDDDNLLPYPRTNSKTAKELMERPDMIWNRQQIHNQITQGVLQGESIPKIAKRMEKIVGMNKVQAVRNTRTIMTAVQNKARVDAFDELREQGVEIREMWIATLDNRTRHSHRHLHGEYKDPATGTYSNDLEYPGDPNGAPEEVYNCRCTEVCEVGSIHIDVPLYSPKLGSMTFDEWLDAKR